MLNHSTASFKQGSCRERRMISPPVSVYRYYQCDRNAPFPIQQEEGRPFSLYSSLGDYAGHWMPLPCCCSPCFGGNGTEKSLDTTTGRPTKLRCWATRTIHTVYSMVHCAPHSRRLTAYERTFLYGVPVLVLYCNLTGQYRYT
jgi:hypothetical protein